MINCPLMIIWMCPLTMSMPVQLWYQYTCMGSLKREWLVKGVSTVSTPSLTV